MKRRVKRHTVVQPQDQSYRLIPLTQGQNAIVDVRDFDWLSQWNWYAHWNRDSQMFYAVRNTRLSGIHTIIRMHQVITGAPQTDHRNRNGLDNRRANLRECTQSQNNFNRPVQANSSTGFKGVDYSRHAKKWRARVHTNRKVTHLGYFATPEEAAQAYNEAAKKLHGEFARLN